MVLENVVSSTFGESLRSVAQNAVWSCSATSAPSASRSIPASSLRGASASPAPAMRPTRTCKIALHLLATGAVKPFIGAVLPFPRVAEGHAMMEQRGVVGRVVLYGW